MRFVRGVEAAQFELYSVFCVRVARTQPLLGLPAFEHIGDGRQINEVNAVLGSCVRLSRREYGRKDKPSPVSRGRMTLNSASVSFQPVVFFAGARIVMDHVTRAGFWEDSHSRVFASASLAVHCPEGRE